MAPSQGTVKATRWIALYAVLLVAVYLLIFLTGDKEAKPKLGIDLQGGTRVTLTARTPDGSAPSRDSLDRAQQIIENRVNGLGVAGSEVIVDGSNLVITVPGDDSSQARALGQTARLYIRPVVNFREAQPETPPAQPNQPGAPPAGNTTPGAPPGAPPTAEPSGAPQPQGRVLPAHQQPAPEPTPTPAPTPTPTPAPTPAPTGDLSGPDQIKKEIEEAKATRQSDNPQIQQLAFLSMDCSKPDPLTGNDDPKLPLVACSNDGKFVYVLGPTMIDGQEIADAASVFNTQQARNEVSVEFKSGASETWAKETQQRETLMQGDPTKSIAFTLDTKVVSAPQVQSATPVGQKTSITGNFTAPEAKELANTLKYGSLPLSFSSSEAETVSATLGLSSLRAGLIAGAVGLVAVLIYCLLYYRALGFLAGFSLVASGVMVYGILVLLGRWINFTLDLAGIAGLIIGIGMTADSFVVFFERIKDEMREGRSFRSAVPRGWGRAQRTNLSGKTVSLIASAVLYILAAGQVRGFAFTLGITTVLDIVVLYLITGPLMQMAARSTFWAKPSVNGLGAVQAIARERKEAAALLVKEK